MKTIFNSAPPVKGARHLSPRGCSAERGYRGESQERESERILLISMWFPPNLVFICAELLLETAGISNIALSATKSHAHSLYGTPRTNPCRVYCKNEITPPYLTWPVYLFVHAWLRIANPSGVLNWFPSFLSARKAHTPTHNCSNTEQSGTHTHTHPNTERERDSLGSICDQPNKHVLLDPTVYHDGASVLLLA